MIAISAVAGAIVFALALERTRVVQVAAAAAGTTLTAARALTNAALSDDEKERLLRRASVALIGAFVSIAARTALSAAAAVLPLLALQVTGLLRLAAVGQWLTTWSGTVVTGSAMTAIYLVRNRS